MGPLLQCNNLFNYHFSTWECFFITLLKKRGNMCRYVYMELEGEECFKNMNYVNANNVADFADIIFHYHITDVLRFRSVYMYI